MVYDSSLACAATAAASSISGSGGLGLGTTWFAPSRPDADRCSVVLAHGFGQTRGAWGRTGLALAAHGYAGLSYDARGHGESDRNPVAQVYTGEQFADDLIVVAGEQPQPPVLVGASMGGLFGLVAESRWPGLFRALILVDVTPRWERAGMERILDFMTAFPTGFDSLEHAGDIIAAYLPHRANRKSPQELREILRQESDGHWRWHWDPRLIEEMATGMEAHQELLADAARAVRCPVLLISGGRSDLVSASTVEEFQALVPHARHAHLPDATHMLAGDDNTSFTEMVLNYLAGLPAIAADHLPAPARESTVTESVGPASTSTTSASTTSVITTSVSGARP